jgi:argininosuccinate lyase
MNSSRNEYLGYRASIGRLSEPAVLALHELKSDVPLEQLHGLHSFDLAHVVMLTETGIIQPEIGRCILVELNSIPSDDLLRARVDAGGGIHSGEQLLIKKLGMGFGGYMHIGRSSGDLGETSKRMAIRSHIEATLESLLELRATLLARAAEHLETILPAYTHGLQAQPTSFAHFLTMHAAGFARDSQRLMACHERINLCPAGAAILSGSDFPLDRNRVAELLGFEAPQPHTMDAILSHDVDTEYVSVLAIIGQNLSRLADDLMQFSTTEFAMVELADRHCGTSSIMPQKKNPDLLEHIKASAGIALGAIVTIAINERGPTGWPVLERRTNHTLMWALGQQMAERLRWMSDVIAGITIKPDRMLSLAKNHWSTATDLAAMLVRDGGLDWRSSHAVVGLLVRRATDRGQGPGQLHIQEVLDAAEMCGVAISDFTDDDLKNALDPTAAVARRTLLGGPAPDAVQYQIAAADADLSKGWNCLEIMRKRQERAEWSLQTAVEAIIAEP